MGEVGAALGEMQEQLKTLVGLGLMLGYVPVANFSSWMSFMGRPGAPPPPPSVHNVFVLEAVVMFDVVLLEALHRAHAAPAGAPGLPEIIHLATDVTPRAVVAALGAVLRRTREACLHHGFSFLISESLRALRVAVEVLTTRWAALECGEEDGATPYSSWVDDCRCPAEATSRPSPWDCVLPLRVQQRLEALAGDGDDALGEQQHHQRRRRLQSDRLQTASLAFDVLLISAQRYGYAGQLLTSLGVTLGDDGQPVDEKAAVAQAEAAAAEARRRQQEMEWRMHVQHAAAAEAPASPPRMAPMHGTGVACSSGGSSSRSSVAGAAGDGDGDGDDGGSVPMPIVVDPPPPVPLPLGAQPRLKEEEPWLAEGEVDFLAMAAGVDGGAGPGGLPAGFVDDDFAALDLLVGLEANVGL